MKNIVLIALMLFGMTLPANARVEMTGDSPSVLFWLEFKVNNGGDGIDDEDDNNHSIKPFTSDEESVAGRLYSDGQMELWFDSSEAVIVSINLNDSEVSSTEFVPTENGRFLTFDLDDFGNGAYEVNVTMSDGTVRTAAFEYWQL